GDRVGLIGKRSIETMAQVLGILKAGGAYVPIDPDYPEERRSYIAEHSSSKLVLSPGMWEREGMERYCAADVTCGSQAGDAAYIIYTSGSTGRPKGVMTGHRAVCNTIQDMNRKLGITGSDRFIGLSSMSFDLSVYDLFGAWSAGAALVLVADQRDMENVLHTVKEKGITVWNSVPALMDLAVACMQEDEAVLPLRSVLLSGDWIPLNLPERIKQRFPKADVISLGGATEASIWSIYYPIGQVQQQWKSIPYGRPLANQKFYVLNYELEPCPVGVEGDLFIGGIGLAEGYWNDDEKTAKAFLSHPKLGRLYATGDRGRWNTVTGGTFEPSDAGNESGCGGTGLSQAANGRDLYIEFLGRRDDQVKIRGYRIELGEISNCLMEHEAVRHVIVRHVNRADGSASLCAYYVADEDQAENLRAHAVRKLPDYMIPSYFVRISSLPMTPNGKVDFRALPEPGWCEMADKESCVAPRTETEMKLARLWQEILQSGPIGIRDGFLELGGNSIAMVQLVNRIRMEFGVQLSLLEFMKAQTIEQLSQIVYRMNREPGAEQDSYSSKERKTEAPLSFFQEGLYVSELMSHASRWCIAASVMISGMLDAGRFLQAVQIVVQKQGSLRTVIRQGTDHPIQKQAACDQIEVQQLDAAHLSEEERASYVEYVMAATDREEFDLKNGPLFRLRLLRLGLDSHVFVIGLHHMIADECSFAIFMRELIAAYSGLGESKEFRLPELPYQYVDYACLQHERQQATIAAEVAYWRRQLAGRLSYAAIPGRKKARSAPLSRGRYVHFELDDQLVSDFVQLCHKEKVTLFTGFLSVFAALIYRLSGDEDIIVGAPVSSRQGRDMEDMIGFFTNVVALRTRMHHETRFTTLLQDVQTTVLGALQHALVPFDRIARELSLDRRLLHLPHALAFNYFDSFKKAYELQDVRIAPLQYYEKEAVPHQLGLTVEHAMGRFNCAFSYQEELFERTSIEQMQHYFKEMLHQAVAHADRIPILDYPLTGEQSKQANRRSFEETFRL
ncbi:condensation domain-containing protein, partial [Paenibacillus dendritiformis]|uniref:condensation domain-containing protein n=1 Tax=Paenibacillus dendritiformis TaxID=130049 RepID=UPI0018CF4BC2